MAWGPWTHQGGGFILPREPGLWLCWGEGSRWGQSTVLMLSLGSGQGIGSGAHCQVLARHGRGCFVEKVALQ